MKIEQAVKIMEDGFKKRKEIRLKKAKDYAGDEDCLQNFKKMAELVKLLNIDVTTPHGIAMIYAVLKIDRICNLIFRKKTKPQNESVEDSINDLQNYIDLFKECLIEGGK